ncbi:MAG: hypothetical protein H6R26_1420, partial [Proteobacteria bacterium]|nr:hypothetical protein [Pseudomonadota bacterium]
MLRPDWIFANIETSGISANKGFRVQVDIIREFTDESWASPSAPVQSAGREEILESGNVLYFPRLRFALEGNEERFLSDRWSDGKSKNISLRRKGATSLLRGSEGSPDELEELRAMMQRFADSAELLVRRLFPFYQPTIRRGFTSFRPHAVTGRETSWRKDDTRLHVDSFPSNPTGGKRLLRVFTNVHPDAVPRVWRV